MEKHFIAPIDIGKNVFLHPPTHYFNLEEPFSILYLKIKIISYGLGSKDTLVLFLLFTSGISIVKVFSKSSFRLRFASFPKSSNSFLSCALIAISYISFLFLIMLFDKDNSFFVCLFL